jgi:hypothetical protein
VVYGEQRGVDPVHAGMGSRAVMDGGLERGDVGEPFQRWVRDRPAAQLRAGRGAAAQLVGLVVEGVE